MPFYRITISRPGLPIFDQAHIKPFADAIAAVHWAKGQWPGNVKIAVEQVQVFNLPDTVEGAA